MTRGPVAPLRDLCLQCLAKNFIKRPSFAGLTPQFAGRVISLLSSTLPLSVTAPVVDDEGYWERNCRARWKNCVLDEHGGLWKRMYLERNLADVIENLDFTRMSPTEFEELLRISAPHVVRINIGQVITHLDLQKLIVTLTRLASLRICFTVRKVGLDFDWSLFGIRLDDATRLAAGLRATGSLSTLELPRCMVDDTSLRALADGIAANSSLTHLDLSHNRITDDGVRALARALLQPGCNVRHLDLSDNQLRAHGGRALAPLLDRLAVLHLRLNRLGDEGARLLAAAPHAPLLQLTLAANGLGPAAVPPLCALIRSAPRLTALDLSSNALGADAGRELREAVEAAPALRSIDLRQTGLSADAVSAIAVLARDRSAMGAVQLAAGALAALGVRS